MPNRYGRPMMGWVIIIALAFLVMTLLMRGFESRREISPAEFWTYIENGQVEGKLLIRKESIEGTNPGNTPGLKKDEPRNFKVVYSYEALENFDQRLREALAKHNNPAAYFYKEVRWWEGLLPQLLVLAVVFLAIWLLLFRRMGAASGGGGFLAVLPIVLLYA